MLHDKFQMRQTAGCSVAFINQEKVVAAKVVKIRNNIKETEVKSLTKNSKKCVSL